MKDDPAVTPVVEPPIVTPSSSAEEQRRRAFLSFWFLIGAGWLSTNIGYALSDIPMRTILMERMHLDSAGSAGFFALTQCTNYIKPIAGVFTDYIPLFGTRRRHYLLISLTACGLMWLVLGAVPKTWGWWFGVYGFLHIFIVLISTTLGGIMVEGGARFQATGRLSAQRVAVLRGVWLVGPIAGWLATKDFWWAAICAASFHFILLPLFAPKLKETGGAKIDFAAIERIKRQGRELIYAKHLWAAAGLVFLVIAAPGFSVTTLFYYQKQRLHFSTEYIGTLKLIAACGALTGAFLFTFICRRWPLRPLVVFGILTHVVAAMMFLGYNDRNSAFVITLLYEAAQTLALLPLYDMAMRATPRGSEAIGYAVMMSVWNVTNALSDVFGAWLFGRYISFTGLVLLNAGSTALVLFAVPFLPRALTDRKEGELMECAEVVETA